MQNAFAYARDRGDAQVTHGPTAAPSAESYAADLISIDVAGFSRFTARLVEEHGAGAAERVRDVLGAGFHAVADQLRDAGFAPVDSLGDGIVLARRLTHDGALARHCLRAEASFAQATGGLQVRAAAASGDLNLCKLGGWRGTWETLATGAAVDAVHDAMVVRRQRADRTSDAPATAGVRDPAKASVAPLMTAEIRRLVVVFVALKAADGGQVISLGALHEATLSAQRLAESWGGRLEKVSHDDKGILLNLCFARARTVGARAADSALDCIIDLAPVFEKFGLSARFGVAEGSIYRGPLLLGERQISIVHGPTVNRSAKLTSIGSASLIVDATAFEALGARLGGWPSIDIVSGGAAKGYELPRAPAEHPARAVAVETFGREREIDVLGRALQRLGEGAGGFVTIAGAPGLGKTRVLQAFRALVSEGVRIVSVNADPKRASDYMFLWHEVVGDLARTHSGHFQAAMSDGGVAREFHSIIGDVVGGFAPSAAIEALPPGARRDLLERAIKSVVGFVARRERFAIVVDDAHWLDEASCQLLGDVMGEVPGALFVLAHRDDHYPHLQRLGAICPPQRIALAPLDRSAIGAIVARTKPALAEDADARENVFNLSGGNPFHAEQIAYWLNQGGVGASLSPSSTKKIQQVVLDERLDGLSTHETGLVRLLSVFDRPLSVSDLTVLQARSGHTLHVGDAIATLSANGFISTDADTASMRHRLLSDAVTARIPPSEAQSLHALAARFLTQRRKRRDDRSISDAVIAGHWREAGAAARAAVRFGKGGDAALHSGAHRLAANLFAEAIAIVPPRERTATGKIAGWHAGSAAAHWAQGDMVSALASSNNALAILDERMGGPRLLPRLARRTIARSRRTLLAAVVQSAVPRAARQPLVILSNARAEMGLYLNSLTTILSANTTMLSLVSNPRLHARGRARAYSFLGHVASLMKWEAVAHGAWNRARRAGEQFQDPTASSHGYLGEALWHVSHGRWGEMRAQLAKATELMGGLNDPVYFKFVETLYGLGAYFEGDWQQCLERFVALQQQGVKHQDRSTEAWGLYAQAEALIVPGRLDEAMALLDQAQPLIDSMPDKQSEIICSGLRAQILLLKGATVEALAQAQACLKLATALNPVNFGSLEGFAAPAEVALRVALDESAPTDVRGEAVLMIKAALKALAKFARVHPIARPRLELCRALAERQRGNAARAREHLARGLELATKIPMGFERSKLEAEIARANASP